MTIAARFVLVDRKSFMKLKEEKVEYVEYGDSDCRTYHCKFSYIPIY